MFDLIKTFDLSNILPTFCQHFAKIQPKCCQNAAKVAPFLFFSQPLTSIFESSRRNQILSKLCGKSAKILPNQSQWRRRWRGAIAPFLSTPKALIMEQKRQKIRAPSHLSQSRNRQQKQCQLRGCPYLKVLQNGMKSFSERAFNLYFFCI